MADEIHKDDVGNIFRVTVVEDGAAIDVSASSTKQIFFKKPDGMKLTKTATFTVDGSDGRIEYAVIAGDLDQIGIYRIQAYVVIGSNYYYSEIQSFKVYDNL